MTQEQADAIVVYWITDSPLEWRVECLNPTQGNNPLLTGKNVHHNPSNDCFGRTKTPAGSWASMALDYSHCPVLASGPA